MIKLVTLLKRKPGMSIEDFIEYYENYHAKLGEKYLSPYAVRYVRRYFRPFPKTTEQTDPCYDAATEIWFPDQSALDAVFAGLGTAEARAEIAEDEAKLFDCRRMHIYLIEEYESDLGGN